MIAPHVVLGGPGCGKTTRLLNIVRDEMNAGVPSSNIAFVTFTKAAATEAKDRAAAQFGLDPETDLPWFRTIHSLAYARMNVERDEIMDRRDWEAFADVVGEEIAGAHEPTDGAPLGARGNEVGDILLRIVDFATTTRRTLDDAWRYLNEAVDWFRLRRFADALETYKADTGKLDFNDLLRNYLAAGPPVPVAVAVIDEAQDLTAIQWAVVRHAFSGAARVYVGGDDDQAIYEWAGADVPEFLGLTATPEVLSLSHRLPRTIHALSQTIARRISQRYAKPFRASDRAGTIEWHARPDSVDLSAGRWLLLARNTYMLRRLEAMVREQGINYTRRSGAAVAQADVRAMTLWDALRAGTASDFGASEAKTLARALDVPRPQTNELARYTLASFGWTALGALPWADVFRGIASERRDFYLACAQRGERLAEAPRVRIETIHGVKGAEAENVLLLTDMSQRTAKSFALAPDNEHRVFYVGVTRAIEALHLVSPQSDTSYPIDP